MKEPVKNIASYDLSLTTVFQVTLNIMNLLKLNVFLISLFAVGSVQAADDILPIEFTTGKYQNNQMIEKWLGIKGAKGLEVRIKGETEEHCDYLAIYNKKHRIFPPFSGTIDTLFTVSLSSIRVVFKSDERTTKEGVTVTVAPLSPASAFNEMRFQLLAATTKILKSGTNKIYPHISEHLEAFKTLNRKLQNDSKQEMAPLVTDMATILMAMAKSYLQVTTAGKKILVEQQKQLKNIEKLKIKTVQKIEKIRKEGQQLLSKRDAIPADLGESIEDQKKKYSRENYEKEADTLSKLQQIWEEFCEEQMALKEELEAYSKKIDLLLHFLKINADIYQQVASVISLRKTDIAALGNLPKLSELQTIITDLGEIEAKIHEHLEKIGQTHF